MRLLQFDRPGGPVLLDPSLAKIQRIVYTHMRRLQRHRKGGEGTGLPSRSAK
jgi:hypothetical protein